MKEVKPNIFIVGSPWHAILADTISKEKDIFIIEYSTIANLTSIKNTIKDKSKILISVDGSLFYFSYAIKKLFTNSSYIRKNVDFIRNKISKLKVEKMYVFNLNSQFSAFCLHNINKARTIKVEDGVCDYLSFGLKQETKLFREIKLYISKVFGLDKIHFPKKILEDESLFFFPERAPNKYKNKKSLFSLKDSIIQKLDKLDPPKLEITKNDVLIIGQTMYEDKYCSLTDEMHIYLSISKNMKEKGCKNILYKPHPRTCLKKLNLLKKYENQGFIQVLRSDFMVEEILAKYNFAYVLGMWSNPIIYSRPIFNVESFSMIPTLLKLKKNNFLYEINREMINIFPEFYKDYKELK